MNRSFFIGVALTTLVAVGVIFWLMRKHKAETDGLSSLIAADKGQIAYFQNKDREHIAQAVQARVSLDQYKESHPEEVAAILKEFNIKPSQLGYYLSASFRAENKGVTVVRRIYVPDTTKTLTGEVRVDSVQKSVFDISDKFLVLHGEINPRADMWETVDWRYTYTDTLAFVGRTDRKWFGGRERYYVDGRVSNPKAQIVSLRNVEITEFRDKRFGVGPQIMLDPFSGTVRVGIGVTYSLIRF